MECRLLLRISCVAAIVGLFGALTWANEWVRPLSPLDYSEQSKMAVELAHPVSGAKIAWADYAALRRDFPKLEMFSPSQIDEWLLKNFAYVGESQPRLDQIRNSAIPLDAGRSKKHAFRPSAWRRSAVLEAGDDIGHPMGLVDIKGFGHGSQSEDLVKNQVNQAAKVTVASAMDQLRVSGHSDGLMSLGEAIAEVSRQQAVQKILQKSLSGSETVESYAIISLPFDILKDKGKKIPAALYLRQAHEGRESGLYIPRFAYNDEAGGFQRTSTHTAVDFGAVTLEEPQLSENWGRVDSHLHWEPQRSKPWIWAHETAEAYAKGGDRTFVEGHLRQMSESIDNWIKRDQKYFPEASQKKADTLIKTTEQKVHETAALPYAERLRLFNEWHEQIPVGSWVEEEAHHSDPAKRRALAVFLKARSDEQSTETLGKMLRDSNVRVREAAGEALAGRSDLHSLQVIEKGIKEADVGVRRATVRALEGRKDLASLKLLERALNDSDLSIQMKAATILREMKGIEAIEVIERGLQGGDASTAILAASALEGRGDSESLRAIAIALKSHDEGVLRHASASLLGRKDSISLDLIERTLGHRNRGVVKNAIAALGGRDDERSLFLLEKAVHQEVSELRLQAMNALSGRQESLALDLLAEGLHDSVESVQLAAVKSLGSRTDLKSLHMIEEVLFSRNWTQKQLAAIALKGRTDDESVKLIAKVFHRLSLDDSQGVEERGIRIHLVKALEGHSDVSSLRVIERAIRDSEMKVRDEALRVLCLRSDDETKKLLEKTYSNGDARVRSQMLHHFQSRTDSFAMKAKTEIFLKDPNLDRSSVGRIQFDIYKRLRDPHSCRAQLSPWLLLTK